MQFLFCISLMLNDVEHCSVGLFTFHIFYFLKCLFKIFGHLKIVLSLFCGVVGRWFLYYLGYQSFVRHTLYECFLLVFVKPIHFLTVSFHQEKFLILIRSTLSFFSLMVSSSCIKKLSLHVNYVDLCFLLKALLF